MKVKLFILLLGLGLFSTPGPCLAQEIEESAEVSLEEYSDDFQENFFEALKQKGIENYDKAINLFLECKRIQADNHVVDHELAKVYMAAEHHVLAQEYAILALNSEPSNLWYLNTLVDLLQKQGNTLDAVTAMVPSENNKLKENLALILYKRGNYLKALNVLDGIKKSSFTKDLGKKINDSLEQQDRLRQKALHQVTAVNESDPLGQYKSRIAGFITKNDLANLESVAAEALETYPSQPYFYYANGLLLNRRAKHKEAAELLESALDYLLDDVALSNKIYKELADAYTSLGNSSKANMYLSKIKPGF